MKHKYLIPIILAIIAFGIGFTMSYKNAKEAKDAKARKEAEAAYKEEHTLNRTHLGGHLYAFCVDGHEYLELQQLVMGAFTSAQLGTLIHSESCLCHQGKVHDQVTVYECTFTELYENTYKISYNGHDYLATTPYGGGFVHMASCQGNHTEAASDQQQADTSR